MKIYEKIKEIREFKKISQDMIAFELSLDQSQYYRREKDEIKFVVDEIEIISKILDTKISQIYGEETLIFNNHDQKGESFGQYVSVPEKLIEQYEIRLLEKEKLIAFLKEQISYYNK
jgi:transcriptional regulator with XRE-family HTH domain